MRALHNSASCQPPAKTVGGGDSAGSTDEWSRDKLVLRLEIFLQRALQPLPLPRIPDPAGCCWCWLFCRRVWLLAQGGEEDGLLEAVVAVDLTREAYEEPAELAHRLCAQPRSALPFLSLVHRHAELGPSTAAAQQLGGLMPVAIVHPDPVAHAPALRVDLEVVPPEVDADRLLQAAPRLCRVGGARLHAPRCQQPLQLGLRQRGHGGRRAGARRGSQPGPLRGLVQRRVLARRVARQVPAVTRDDRRLIEVALLAD